jgi:hypothetical protein
MRVFVWCGGVSVRDATSPYVRRDKDDIMVLTVRTFSPSMKCAEAEVCSVRLDEGRR